MYIMQQKATQSEIDDLCRELERKGLKFVVVKGEIQSTVHPIGDEYGKSLEELIVMPGVKEFVKVGGDLKIVPRENHPEYNGTKVKPLSIGDVVIGSNGNLVVIAGPCAVQTYEQTLEVAKAAKEAGADIIRGGAWKPRSSPYSKQGLGEEGVKILAEVGKKLRIPVMAEVLDPRHVEFASKYLDVLWVGARNAGNIELYKEVGRQDKPVLIKNSHTGVVMSQWLAAAEYVLSEGNTNIAFIYRGEAIPPADSNLKGIFDVKKLLDLHQKTYFPIIVDPSHAAGINKQVPQLAYAAATLPGVHALMIEVIPELAKPEDVWSDYKQGLRPSEFKEVVARARQIYKDTR